MHIRHANNSQNLLLNFESVAAPGTRILVQTNAAGIAHVADERDARALVATGVFAWITGDPAVARDAAAQAEVDAAALAAFDAPRSKDEAKSAKKAAKGAALDAPADDAAKSKDEAKPATPEQPAA